MIFPSIAITEGNKVRKANSKAIADWTFDTLVACLITIYQGLINYAR